MREYVILYYIGNALHGIELLVYRGSCRLLLFWFDSVTAVSAYIRIVMGLRFKIGKITILC